MVNEYVDTYLRLLNNTSPYDRLQSLASDSEKLLALSETLGTMLVDGSMGYVKVDSENKTRIRLHGLGFSTQFGKLNKFFNDKSNDPFEIFDMKWLRYVDFRRESGLWHGCFSGPPCFSDTQDKLDALTSLMGNLFENLGVNMASRARKIVNHSRPISNRYNPTTFRIV